MKKIIYISTVLLMVIAVLPVISAITANPIISRGKTVYTSSGTVSYLTDNLFGGTSFSVSNGSWIAINVGSGYSKVIVNWNNPIYSWSDSLAASHSCKTGLSCPVDYTIQESSNSTNGSDGDWTTALSVTNNRVSARCHVVDFSGASWVRMSITTGGGSLDEIEVFDASNDGDDIWFFPGTSISANTYKGAVPSQNFADLITAALPAYNPVMVRGGIPCILSNDIASDISKYLATTKGVKYWAIEMGTNDAWGGANANAATFKKNMQLVIDSCKAAGINPMIARMISTNESAAGWQVNEDFLTAIDDLTTQNGLVAGPDLYNWFLAHPDGLTSDGVHPNATGNAYIQQLWAEAMASLYDSTTIAVTGVTLSADSASVTAGSTLRLTATLTPSNATIKAISWASSNTSVATVSSTGLVTGIAAGTATITVTTVDGGKTATCIVTVTECTDCSSCTFGTPLTTALPSISNSYNYVYVLGTGGPDLGNVTNFIINWDLPNKGLYQFSMGTNNGNPNWYNDLRTGATWDFASASPSITLSGAGFTGLDGSYYVTVYNTTDFVMVSQTGLFTIYFSNSTTEPTCAKSAKIDQAETTNNVVLYPNPFTKKITIATGNIQLVSVKVINQQGALIQLLGTDQLSGDCIELGEDLLPGIYFVQVNDVQGYQTYKIVKQ